MDVFFTGILVTLIVMWVLGVRGILIGRLAAVMKRHITLTSSLFWTAFAVFLAFFIIDFDYFDRIHDIDDAVNAAVESLDAGINPYEEDVIPRFEGRWSPDVQWTEGPYNYMPLDLYVYYGLHSVFGVLGSPLWFVVTNLMFSFAAFVLLRGLITRDWVVYAPVAGIVMLFYAFDNASLTMFLIVLSMYAYRRLSWHPAVLAILVMALATMTKVFAVIPFAVLVIYELDFGARAGNWRRPVEAAGAAAAGGVVALALMAPFGVRAVLDAAVFFHASEEMREGTSAGGTVLGELMAGSESYAVVSVVVLVFSLVIGLRLMSLSDRILLAIVAFMLVAVKSSLAIPIVGGVFLMLRLKELHDERPSQADSEASGTPTGVQEHERQQQRA
ncbi:MAG: hypothetical protein JSV90_04990 [Methanobacteriota archaeon]|nr:MAG: hypothetical protein JSV90_04990 [Euryarchaeota archaeon]